MLNKVAEQLLNSCRPVAPGAAIRAGVGQVWPMLGSFGDQLAKFLSWSLLARCWPSLVKLDQHSPKWLTPGRMLAEVGEHVTLKEVAKCGQHRANSAKK